MSEPATALDRWVAHHCARCGDFRDGDRHTDASHDAYCSCPGAIEQEAAARAEPPLTAARLAHQMALHGFAVPSSNRDEQWAEPIEEATAILAALAATEP